MLISGRHTPPANDSARDSVHNYYERFVFEQLLRASDKAKVDANFFADVACVALNQLPPRYVRFDVDMSFFLSSIEMEEMTDKVALAVNQAIDHVESRERNRHAHGMARGASRPAPAGAARGRSRERCRPSGGRTAPRGRSGAPGPRDGRRSPCRRGRAPFRPSAP